MIVDDEHATYVGNFKYSYDHLEIDMAAPLDDSNNDF